MSLEQQRIVECWEKHELVDTDIGVERLVARVTAETGADDATIGTALMAGLGAKRDCYEH